MTDAEPRWARYLLGATVPCSIIHRIKRFSSSRSGLGNCFFIISRPNLGCVTYRWTRSRRHSYLYLPFPSEPAWRSPCVSNLLGEANQTLPHSLLPCI